MVNERRNFTGKHVLFTAAALFLLAVMMCVAGYLMFLNGELEPHRLWAFFGLTALTVLMLGFYLYYGDTKLIRSAKI